MMGMVGHDRDTWRDGWRRHRLGRRRGHRVHRMNHGRGRVTVRRCSCSVGRKGRRTGLLGLCELVEERLGRVILKRQSRLAFSQRGWFLAHLLPLQVSFERVEKEAIVGDAVPVEDLLLFLRSDAVVLVQEVKKRALGFFERRIGAGLEVAQVGEDTLFEFLRVLDRASKGLEAKGETPHDIGS